MRKLFYISIISFGALLLSLCLPSCGGKRGFEEAEETEAEVEAAMMQGREAAKEFINKRWTDSIQLQNNLLEARTKRIQYDTVSKPRCRAAYDSAFVSTIRTVRPDIANALDQE